MGNKASWVHHSSCSPMHCDALVAGHDCDRSPIYVGRACFNGDHLPAKVVPSKHCAYVSWGGKEHAMNQYEVLVGHCYSWVHCHHGRVPHNAVASGNTSQGEPLYIGRTHYNGSLCVGKIHVSHGCIYIPFDGQEVRLEHNYEVLIHQHH